MVTHFQPFPRSQTPVCATIGFFDGVHRGHLFLLEFVRRQARERNLQSAVITFDEHPRRVIHSDYQPALLSTTDEKLALLAKSGIDTTFILHFDAEMAQLPAREFMQTILRQECKVNTLIIGYDHHFGRSANESFEQYRDYGKEVGIEVVQAPAYSDKEAHFSSTSIRKALSAGETLSATHLLGHPYSLEGRVVEGRQLGRTMGFPTANIELPPHKLIPAKGVYLAEALVEGKRHHALVNIGYNPTVTTESHLSVEAYLIGFEGNLYNQTLTLELIRYIRPEMKFANIDELKERIREDLRIALLYVQA